MAIAHTARGAATCVRSSPTPDIPAPALPGGRKQPPGGLPGSSIDAEIFVEFEFFPKQSEGPGISFTYR